MFWFPRACLAIHGWIPSSACITYLSAHPATDSESSNIASTLPSNLDPLRTTSKDRPTNLDHSTILEVPSNLLPPLAEFLVNLDSALDSPPTSLTDILFYLDSLCLLLSPDFQTASYHAVTHACEIAKVFFFFK